MQQPRAGRPKASSREVLAEAACELFLERGYDAVSVADITRRAGVSRSTFFNYVSGKGDLLWAGFDQRVDAVAAELGADDDGDAAASTVGTLRRIGDGYVPDSLALALANAGQMGIAEELARAAALRQARLADLVSARLRRGGASPLDADVRATALAGAVMAALEHWAEAGAGNTAFSGVLDRALAAAAPVRAAGAVRQLRLVVRADDFDDALAFYRDVLGMPQAEAYQADGGARVVILDAGRATLELANSAQVDFIDRVETDGGGSDALRLALEVDDADATTARLAAAGAVLEAAPRETPWRSRNARLRGPAGVQLTVFQELGPPDRPA